MPIIKALSRNKKTIRIFSSHFFFFFFFFHFFGVKFSVYLNRHVFVMPLPVRIAIPSESLLGTLWIAKFLHADNEYSWMRRLI